ncbi:MAG TPA: glycosyltransferase family 2 protein [Candidatus Nanoarchaeia archaeon]|nr:glycosyltransferase family 2 protein [Candidatus Nanoarchaeia archaeon]
MSDFIVLPAYNEGSRIQPILKQIKKITKNIIVVDDGSKDNTVGLVKQLGITVLEHGMNLGKGAALRTGCEYAVQQGAKNIVVMDSDGQHDPKNIPQFLEALKDVEIVYSHRQGAGRQPGVLRFGNNFINNTLKFLFGTKINDSQCGFRAFTAEAYQKIKWEATDYYMETEMIIRASRTGLKYKQIPIDLIYADKYKGTTVLDGVKIVLKIVGGRF